MTQMVVEDLEQIVGDSPTKVYNKKCYIGIGISGLILTVVCIGLLIAVIVIKSHGCSGKSQSPLADARKALMQSGCMDKSCLRASAYMASSIDNSVDPCDDFYKYACGGWMARHDVPADKTKYTVFNELTENNEEKRREYLERRVTRVQHPIERKIKSFNRMCLHDYGRMKDGGKKLVEMLKGNLKGWFVLEPHEWHDSWDFTEAMVTAHVDYNVPVLFDYDVWPQTQATYLGALDTNTIAIYPGGIGMNFRRFTANRYNASRVAYKDLMFKLGGLLLKDANVSVSEAEQDERLQQFVDDAYSVELQLATMLSQIPSSSRWRGGYSTLSELSRNFTQIDWIGIMTRIFERAGVNAGTQVGIRSVQYFQALNEMLKNESDSRDRIMNNYVTWSVLRYYARMLSWDYINARYEHYEDLTGRTEFPTTWHVCLDLVKDRFALALASQFALRHVGSEAKKRVENITNFIRKSTIEKIKSYKWMDDETKQSALIKVNQITENIGFPEEFIKKEHLIEMYNHITVNKSAGFFWNLIESNKFKRFQLNYELEAGRRYSIWVYSFVWSGYSVTPYYHWFYNSLLVPPGSIQFPVYDNKMPMSMNYGGIGSYIASTYIQPTSWIGRYFINGTFSNWWSSDTTGNYSEAERCFRNYYQNMTVGPYIVDGVNKTVILTPRMVWRTLTYIGGLQNAYNAYISDQSNSKKDQSLMGVNLSPDQMFFVSAAQTRCYVQKGVSAYRLASAGYIPDNMKVNGMMTHTPEFTKAFKCSEKNKLYVKQQCSLY